MKIASEKAALDKSSISQFVPRQLLIKVPFFVKNQREINFRPRDVRNLHGQTRAGQIRCSTVLHTYLPTYQKRRTFYGICAQSVLCGYGKVNF